jgi:hypothetical protein
MWPEREINHSPPNSADAMNEWSYTCTALTCLYGVDRKKMYLHTPMYESIHTMLKQQLTFDK